ncbi:MAG: hypothetical protein FJW90_00855 [Actinobacteria bacterium]|nr:hypothetical protein [Actinomycetota bacterium]
MRKQPTALIALGATLALAAAPAQAGPVTVAFYAFSSQADVLAFQKVLGAKCERTWRQRKSMQVKVGAGTNHCAYRSSVVADSSDVRADTEILARGMLAGSTPGKQRKKAFVGVSVRSSENSGYELRVRPFAGNWQLFRDPRGSASGPELFRSGKGKFIRRGLKHNDLALRAFDFGKEETSLSARINGKLVVSVTDTGNSQPDGRRSVVTAGVKGAGSGSGVAGVFDNVSIRVPNPF